MCPPSDKSRSAPPTETSPSQACTTCTNQPARVWAGGIGVPGRYLRKDARLPNPQTGDQTYGQDGWDTCFEFANSTDLRNQLGGAFKLPKFLSANETGFVENQITKLAIHAHGNKGAVDIENAKKSDCPEVDDAMLNVKTLPRYKEMFDGLTRLMADGSTLYFMCCLTGTGVDGNTFLAEVSKLLAAKRVSVVGFTSVLYVQAARQARPAEVTNSDLCTYPGCRETNDAGMGGSSAKALEDGTKWNDLTAYPWASYNTRRATVARLGQIVKKGEWIEADADRPSSWDGKVHPEFQ